MIKIEIEGLDELKKQLEKAKTDVRKKAEDAVSSSLMRIHGRIVKRIQSFPATGKWYITQNSKIPHQASAPGEPPASDSGKLAESAFWEEGGLTGYVGVKTSYAHALEFGTSKMETRPFIFPSVEEDAKNFKHDLERILK